MGQQHDAVDGQSRHPGGPTVGADGQHLPTKAQVAIEEEEGQANREHHQDQVRHWQARNLGLREAREGIGQPAEWVRMGEDQHRPGDEARRRKGHDETVDSRPRDQQRVAESKERAGGQREQHSNLGRQPKHLHRPTRDHPGRAADGAHREVEVADRKRDHLGKADGDLDRRETQQREEVEVGREAGRRHREIDPEADGDNEQPEQGDLPEKHAAGQPARAN